MIFCNKDGHNLDTFFVLLNCCVISNLLYHFIYYVTRNVHMMAASKILWNNNTKIVHWFRFNSDIREPGERLAGYVANWEHFLFCKWCYVTDNSSQWSVLSSLQCIYRNTWCFEFTVRCCYCLYICSSCKEILNALLRYLVRWLSEIPLQSGQNHQILHRVSVASTEQF